MCSLGRAQWRHLDSGLLSLSCVAPSLGLESSKYMFSSMSICQCWLLTETSSGIANQSTYTWLSPSGLHFWQHGFSSKRERDGKEPDRRCVTFCDWALEASLPLHLIGAVMKGSHLTHFKSFSIMKMGQMTSKVPKHFFVHCQKYRMTPYISWFCTFIHIISSPLPAQSSSPIIHPGSRDKRNRHDISFVPHSFHLGTHKGLPSFKGKGSRLFFLMGEQTVKDKMLALGILLWPFLENKVHHI